MRVAGEEEVPAGRCLGGKLLAAPGATGSRKRYSAYEIGALGACLCRGSVRRGPQANIVWGGAERVRDCWPADRAGEHRGASWA